MDELANSRTADIRKELVKLREELDRYGQALLAAADQHSRNAYSTGFALPCPPLRPAVVYLSTVRANHQLERAQAESRAAQEREQTLRRRMEEQTRAHAQAMEAARALQRQLEEVDLRTCPCYSPPTLPCMHAVSIRGD